MYTRLWKKYEDGVKEFIKFIVECAENPSRITCYCLDYCYSSAIGIDELLTPLVCKWVDNSFSVKWNWSKLYMLRWEKKQVCVRYASSDLDTNTYQCKLGWIDSKYN